MTNTKSKIVNEPVTAGRWRMYFVIAVCIALLVAGFFFAGQQHFSSIDFGMKNSRLRKQIDDLEAEKRRLLLVREMSLAPAEIRKAAGRTGLAPGVNGSPQVERASAVVKEKPRSFAPAAPASVSLVQKTASITPVPRWVPATEQRPDRPARQMSRQMKKALAAE